VTIRLNSIGCRKCRAQFKKVLLNYIEPRRPSLCDLCQKRTTQNPFRVLDCKDESCKKVIQEAPAIAHHLCPTCSEHFESVKEGLDRLGVSYELDPRLFRGIDYYTKTTFEFVSSALGAKDTILGGGRYDYLVEELGGQDTPAIGWAFGVDRLILALEQEEFTFPGTGMDSLFVAWTSDATKQKSVEIVHQMRQAGIACEMDYDERSLRSQLNLANRLGFSSALIVGDEELSTGEVVLRNMRTGSQEKIPLAGLEEHLKERLKPC
jgi:histidyl-tRNA synthetase